MTNSLRSERYSIRSLPSSNFVFCSLFYHFFKIMQCEVAGGTERKSVREVLEKAKRSSLPSTSTDIFAQGGQVSLCSFHWLFDWYIYWLVDWSIGWLVGWLVGWLIYAIRLCPRFISFIFIFLFFIFLNYFQGFPFRDGRDLDRNRGSNNMGGVVNRRRSDGYNHDRGSYGTMSVIVIIVESICWFSFRMQCCRWLYWCHG